MNNKIIILSVLGLIVFLYFLFHIGGIITIYNNSNNDYIEEENYKKCVRSGCSGQLCVEEGKEIPSTCEWTCKYGCYKDKYCKRINGQCKWDETPEFKECAENCKLF